MNPLITLDELKDRISACLGVEEILDILGMGTPDLVEALSSQIAEARDEFEQAVK
jgi:hypothetical protein